MIATQTKILPRIVAVTMSKRSAAVTICDGERANRSVELPVIFFIDTSTNADLVTEQIADIRTFMLLLVTIASSCLISAHKFWARNQAINKFG